MGLGHSPSIVLNGLVLCLDAGNTKSYLNASLVVEYLVIAGGGGGGGGGAGGGGGDGGYRGHPFQVSFLVAEHRPRHLLYFQLVVTQ